MMFEVSEGRVVLNLNIPELTYLARCLGADMLVGIGDPFLGWLTEEIEEAWAVAHKSLLEKGLIREREGGGVIIDVVVAAIVSTCAWPDLTVFDFRRETDSTGKLDVFHIGETLSVEQTYPEGENDIYLTIHDELDSVKGRIWDLTDIKDGEEEIDASLSINMDALWKAISAKKEEIPGILAREQSNEKAADLLSDTLSSKFTFSSLVGVKVKDGDWRLKGIGFISDGECLWEVMPNLESEDIHTIVSTCDIEKARKDTEALIDAMLT